MDLFYDDVLINATELIKDRFSFISIRTEEKPKSTTCTHYFSIDSELVYESFFNDFGPLNLSMLYRYCFKVNKKLKYPASQRIVHYTTFNDQKRVNAACLACSYAIIYLNYTPERLCELLAVNNSLTYIDFRDASVGTAYTITLADCLNAVYKAHKLGFFNFDDFDFLQYEHFERVANGDLNWIIPGKFIGFCGPHNRSAIENGYALHSPESYFSYFRRHHVTTIIRLNKKMYDASKFTKAGFAHKDMYFIDGSTPSDKIVNQFITICEKTDGAVAVHCKAGLGRTGSLIGCYIMKHYKFTARETIAWVRMCRPGSIIGHQQSWLENKQNHLWKLGDEYRAKLGMDDLPKHTRGLYSFSHGPELGIFPKRSPKKNDVSGILQKVDTMQLEDKDGEEDDDIEPMTQGDRLNQIKAQRRQRVTRQLPINEKKVFRGRVLVSPIDTPTILRGGKVIGMGIKSSGASTSRSLTKRNGTNEKQVALRRSMHRKTNMPTAKPATITNGQSRSTARVILRSTLPKKLTIRKLEVCDDRANSFNGEGTMEPKTAKRGKRSLTLEKERLSTRSVKVSKRCHLQSSTESAPKSQPKLLLPHVNKNSKTP